MAGPRTQPSRHLAARRLGRTRAAVVALVLAIGSPPTFGAPARGAPVPGSGPNAGAVLDRVQAYLNDLSSLRADFLQIAPDGAASTGTVYIARPGGRIRLDYAPPSSLQLIGGDGWITVRDRAADEDSRWPVGGTPFDALIRDRVDLRRDVRVRDVEQGRGVIRVTVEARDEPEAGSLTLVFTEPPLELRQWQVLDPQNLLTTVTLSNVELNSHIDSRLFEQNDPDLWSDDGDD